MQVTRLLAQPGEALVPRRRKVIRTPVESEIRKTLKQIDEEQEKLFQATKGVEYSKRHLIYLKMVLGALKYAHAEKGG